jgi:hypothetical protein
MGAYKQFLASDIIVAPLEVSKGFTFQGKSEFTSSNIGINRFLGQNVTQFNFDPNLDPITGDYYNVVTPGATASLSFVTTPFNSQAASIGSSSFLINNTTFIITGSGTLPINSNNIIYIPSGSSGTALASSIQNHINNSSSLFP